MVKYGKIGLEFEWAPTWFTFRGEKIRIIGCAEWRENRELYYEKNKF